MSTYENCYEIVSDVRYAINEHSTAYIKGTDTAPIENAYIVKKINLAEGLIYNKILEWNPYEFLTSTTLTGVDSVFTLPWNFGRLVFFRDNNGRRVLPLKVKNLKLEAATGSDNLYYRKGQTLVLDKGGVTDDYTLYYLKRCMGLAYGQADSGSGALAIQLENAKKINDYYNGLTIENITQDWTDEITDYVGSTRVATISETAAEDDWWGIVSALPEEFHKHIAPLAALYVKKEHPVSQEKASKGDFDQFWMEVEETLSAYHGQPLDEDPEELFQHYEIGLMGGIDWEES